MADEKIITETDDEPEIVEVDTLPAPGAEPAKVEEKVDEEDDPPEPDDEEDARLAEHEDDEDDAKAGEDSAARKKRLKRKQLQREARTKLENEVESLRAWKQSVEPQLKALQSNTLDINESHLDARIEQVDADIRLAEQIHAKAIEAGNGADAVEALKLRDEARDLKAKLTGDKATFSKAREAPAPDSRVATHSQQWIAANAGWYGKDAAATATAKQVDAQVAQDGYDPATPAYWQELTRRLTGTFKAPDKDDGEPAPRRRTPPPQGQTREHAPVSTRTQVYLTPDRIQAIKDAGAWEDKEDRNRMARAYAKYDKEMAERER